MSDFSTLAGEPAPVVAPGSSAHTPLLLTTNGGLEPVVAAEFRELVARAGYATGRMDEAPFGTGGYVLVESTAPPQLSVEIACLMRTVHHVLAPLYTFSLPEPGESGLDVIRATLAGLDVPQLDNARTFRVSARRQGNHGFSSVDVQRAAGAALNARHEASVDLKNHEVEVRIDVHHDRCLVGVVHTRQALSRRQERLFQPRAALKPNVAHALLRWAGLATPPATVLDPFCGSGTILREARALWPDARLLGSDWSADTVDGARGNARAQGLGDGISLFRADARELTGALAAGSVDLIVTNPPFGVRHGSGMDFRGFYRDLLEQLHTVLAPGGRAVILVYRRKAFRHALDEVGGFGLNRVRRLEVGGIYPNVFVLERK